MGQWTHGTQYQWLCILHSLIIGFVYVCYSLYVHDLHDFTLGRLTGKYLAGMHSDLLIHIVGHQC